MELIGILLSLSFLVLMSFKRVNIVVGTIVSSFIVIFTNKMDIEIAFFGETNSYIAGIKEFVGNYIILFLLSSILSSYFLESGASECIAEKIISKIGVKNRFSMLIVLYSISALLTYAGINIFVVFFILIPMSFQLFKKVNIPWEMVTLPIFLGGATFTMTMLPGSPSIQNNIPIKYLGTSVFSAPGIGLISSIVCVLFSIFFMSRELKKQKNNNYVYPKVFEKSNNQLKKISLFALIIPVIILFSTISLFGIFSDVNGVYPAMVLSIIYFMIVHRDMDALNRGVMNAFAPLIYTASSMGFGNVIAESDIFKNFFQLLSNNSNSIVSLNLISIFFGGMTASSSSSIAIIMENFSSYYLDSGIPKEVIHRIGVMSSAVLANMPYCGIVSAVFKMSEIDYKRGFRYVFLGFTIAHIFSLIIVNILVYFFY
ncbi:GntP family permease [Enterococcus faecalis]|uniref:GntP family permease n=2 Tax=Enterococcus faecalis TaxID=1351 RepID=UPI002151C059|nr:SLC13 family permease [Enterococcus faecalis]